jgi:hypothetical protein
MKLFSVDCAYSSSDVADAPVDSHVHLVVAAPDFSEAIKRASQNIVLRGRTVLVHGAIEISNYDEYAMTRKTSP